MDDNELKELWRAYDQKLEQSKLLNLQSWVVNLRTMETLQQFKAETTLNSLARFKIKAVVIGILYCLLLGVLVYGNRFSNPYFTISIGCILLFNLAAVVVYIRHIIMIRQMDYSASIVHTQAQLSELESSTVGLRFLWLQMPFYSTFFWHSSWVQLNTPVFYYAILPPTLFFAWLGYWIYHNVSPRNMHKKWVKFLLMAGPEYSSVIKAKTFLLELADFKKDL